MEIYLENISYCYDKEYILHDINLSVERGESIGIIGCSGCGKSTLLKLISGLYDWSAEGINGRPSRLEVSGETIPELIRRKVAMVTQATTLFPVSIRDNITCGHDIPEDKVMFAIEAAQLTKWINELPDGLDTTVGERGSRVSGGQAQRISIARAIAKDAPVILLDEATSALDSDTGTELMRALSDVFKGKTTISVAHRVEVLSGCTRILRIESGCFI